MRFEGPTNKELKDAEVITTITRKNTEQELEEAAQSKNPPPAPEGVPVKYSEQDHETLFSPTLPEGLPQLALKTVKTIGNDALQMLSYIALAKLHLLTGLENLTLYSTSKHDLESVPAYLSVLYLPLLTKLTTLKITLSSSTDAKLTTLMVDQEDTPDQPFLQLILPPSLEELHIRGSVSMAEHLESFADGFPLGEEHHCVLDLPDKASKHTKQPSDDKSRSAKKACQNLLEAAAKRGVAVQEFEEPWVEVHTRLMNKVDERWAEL
ncbi:hypothetical protein N0V88_002592 [Collariella sp. IMI 366227]|nr:hypothetical protein N0V88_002592 [Collariella sp. IMI 366227]